MKKFRPMSADEFRRILTKLNLAQEAAAEHVGRSGRQARRWASGNDAIPHEIASLFRLLASGKITVADLEAAKTARNTAPGASLLRLLELGKIELADLAA